MSWTTSSNTGHRQIAIKCLYLNITTMELPQVAIVKTFSVYITYYSEFRRIMINLDLSPVGPLRE